jgi:protein-tyrosine phosphatase
MLEVMLGAALHDRGLDARVRSAGIWEAGHPASDHSVKEAAARGLDLATHRSQVIDVAMVERADLVLALARRHVVEVGGLVPGAFGRTFTLKEIVRRGHEVGPRRAGEPLADWLAEIGRDRVAASYLRADPADDVEDPIGGSRAKYARTAVELESLAAELADLLQPPPPVSVAADADSVLDPVPDRP